MDESLLFRNMPWVTCQNPTVIDVDSYRQRVMCLQEVEHDINDKMFMGQSQQLEYYEVCSLAK